MPTRKRGGLSLPAIGLGRAACFRLLLLALGGLVCVRSVQAASTTWKGGAVNLDWSTSGNWLNGFPSTATDVLFLTNGVVLTAASNNVLSANATIRSLTYSHTNSSTGTQTYHHTWLNSGVTLTVSNVLATNVVFVGSGLALAGCATTAAVSGSNASLVIVATNGIVNIRQGGSSDSVRSATLDLSGLSNCTVRAQRVLVAGDGTNGSAERDRESGTLKLARNTAFYLASPSFPPSLTVGYTIGNGSGITSNLLVLGQTNHVFSDTGLGVGLGRSPSYLKFGSFANSRAVFRDSAGTGPQAVWLIGDSASLGYWGNYSLGSVDFSGGTLDAQVASIVVGRSVNGTANPAGGGNDGVLTLDAGTLDAYTITAGYQVNDYCARVGGVVNVDGIAQVHVRNAIQLGRFMASAASNGVSSATLNIGTRSGGGSVVVDGSIVTTTNAKNVGCLSQVILRNNGSLSVKGKVGPLSTLELNHAALQLDLAVGAASTPVCVTTNLITTTPVTLTITGNGLAVGTFPLFKYRSFAGSLSDFLAPALPDQTQGYLSNNTSASSIDLVITAASTVTNATPAPAPLLKGKPLYADYGKPLTEAAPRADGYTHVDTPGLITRLLAGNIKTYAYLVWKSNSYRTDWDDFRLEFLPAAQAAGIDVWLYLTPPSENSPPAAYIPFGDDYYSWATEAARLALKYPALKAVVMDDFNSNLGTFTPDYVARMMEGAHAYCTNLLFMPINYDLTKGWASPTSYLSPAFMNAYGPSCGAVILPYLNWASHDDFSNEAYQIAHNSGIVSGALSQFLIFLPSGRGTQAGDVAKLSETLTNSAGFPDQPYPFTFRIGGYPSNSVAGYHQMQLLVDNDVVWSKDFSACYGVQDVTTNLQSWLAGKTNATLTVRVYEQAGVANYWIRPSWILPAGNWVQTETGGFAGASTYYPGTPRGIPMVVMIYDWMYGTGGNNNSNYVYNANVIAQASVQAGQPIGIIQFSLDKTATSPLFPIIQQLYGQWAYQPRIGSVGRWLDGSMQIAGAGGGPNIGYTLKASDDPRLPLAAWAPAATGTFDSSGSFTNLDNNAASCRNRFYRISVP